MPPRPPIQSVIVRLAWTHSYGTVHSNGMAIDVIVANKVQHQLCVFIWASQASRERYRGFQGFTKLRGDTCHHWSFHDARSDSIDTDAMGGQVPSSRDGKRVHSTL